MEAIVTHLLKMVFASGVLYLYYCIALRNRQFHIYNRFYLLLAFVSSLLIPFIHFNWLPAEAAQHLSFPVYGGKMAPALAGQSVVLFPTATVLVSIYILVSSFLAIVICSRIYWIYKVKRSGTKTPMKGICFIETNVSEAPFSFLNNLFWKKEMSFNDENGQRIFAHELTHIQQKHSYDSLFTQITICICWINPFFWLLRKELNVVHEFIADAASVDKGDTQSFALMLLHTHNEGRYINPAHSFFNSSIKRRLAMIQSSKKTTYSYLGRVMSLPVAICLLAFLSITAKAQTAMKDNRTGEVKATQSIDHVEVHGQTGTGDTGIVYFKNGTTERYVLNNPAENKIFQQNYGAILMRQAPLKKQHPPTAPDHVSFDYEPLQLIPAAISEITFGDTTIWLKRKDGIEEQYDLRNAKDRKDFETKYGKLSIRKES